jgi:ABC-type branched-subunit amino acid transport system ATPase component
VVKRFGAFNAVDGASLGVSDRRLHALIGPNGAGKTTLFNAISGLYPPDGGTIALRENRRAAAEAIAARGLARSFQITNLFPSLSVAENLRLGCQARDPARLALWRPAGALTTVNAETQALIRFLGLEGLERVPVASLSYGGQRLVEIGIPLAARPRVLLLDEPLVGLAATERERITALVRSLAPHMAVLLVEHDMDRVFTLADRITAMNEGRVIAGHLDEIHATMSRSSVYLGSGAARWPPRGKAACRMRARRYSKSRRSTRITARATCCTTSSPCARRGRCPPGRNGAGKTSTLKSIMGIVAPASGTITLGGARIDGEAPERVARRGIGLVPQGRRLFSGLTVAENLALGGLHHRAGASGGVHWDSERIFAIFPRLSDRIDTRADRLSGGEQQMVAIARALAGDGRLLLLDEPFEGLSPTMVDDVFAAIAELRRHVSILIIEHHLDLVLALADRAIVLDRGYVSHEGPSEPLLHDINFRKEVLWI